MSQTLGSGNQGVEKPGRNSGHGFARGAVAMAAVVVMVAATASVRTARAQQASQGSQTLATLDSPPTGIAPPGDALRPGHLGRQIENVELDTHFYHDLIGLELRGNREAPRAFGRNIGLQEVAELAQGVPDPHLQSSRVVLLPIPGTAAAAGGPEMTIEAIEIKGIPTKPFRPALTDPGASYLKLIVTDLDATLKVLKDEETPIITPGGAPVDVPSWPGVTGTVRAIFVRDPDGYPVELMQVTPAPESTAAPGSKVLGARVTVVVENIEKTAKMYQSLVGSDFKFWISPSLMGDQAYRDLTGISNQFRLAQALVPGSPVVLELIEYQHHSKRFKRPHFQDPGAAHFLFMSKDDDVMIERVKAAGLHTTSTTNAPVYISKTTRMFFVTDPQGFWLEFMDNNVKPDPDWK